MAEGFSVLNKRFFWASVAIVAIWVAVALVGIFGPELVVNGGADEVRIPAAVIFVSFFGAIATVPVAIVGYRE